MWHQTTLKPVYIEATSYLLEQCNNRWRLMAKMSRCREHQVGSNLLMDYKRELLIYKKRLLLCD